MTDDLRALLEGDAAPDDLLGDLMPALGAALACDRCLLYLRDPHTRRARTTHAWQRKPDFALAREDRGWQEEPAWLVETDPLFAEALRNPAALYIEDVARADPATLNRDFEQKVFRHRALVHAPLYHEGLMVGILEPSVMAAPRQWSAADRAIVALAQAKIAPRAAAYVARHCH